MPTDEELSLIRSHYFLVNQPRGQRKALAKFTRTHWEDLALEYLAQDKTFQPNAQPTSAAYALEGVKYYESILKSKNPKSCKQLGWTEFEGCFSKAVASVLGSGMAAVYERRLHVEEKHKGALCAGNLCEVRWGGSWLQARLVRPEYVNLGILKLQGTADVMLFGNDQRPPRKVIVSLNSIRKVPQC